MAIKNINIKHFRGIDDLEVSNFKRINLIAGTNNSGKSTLLEALFLLMGMSEPVLLARLSSARSNQNIINLSDLIWAFKNSDTQIPILIEGDTEEHRQLLINAVYNKEKTEQDIISTKPDLELTGLEFNYSIGSIKEKKTLTKKGSILDVAEDAAVYEYKESYDATLVDPNTKGAGTIRIDVLNEIIKNKKEGDIVSILKKVEPNIKQISIGANNVIYADVGLDTLIPISEMGDGIKKILSILIHLYYLSKYKGKAVLLLDEIENGLHYSVLKNMWKAIIDAADKFNVQVFATTHNIETLKYLKELLSEDDEMAKYQPEIRYYKMKRLSTGATKAYVYNYEQFENAIEQGIEIR